MEGSLEQMKNRNKKLIKKHNTYMNQGHWEPDDVSSLENPSGRHHNRVKKVVAFVDEEN